MPLVLIHKALRASRRPQWQDTRPPDEELRDSYAIAANNETAFSRAFLRFTRDLMTPEVMNAVGRAVRSDRPEAAVNSLPVLEASDKMRESFERAYAKIIQESGQAEANRHKWGFQFEVEVEVDVEGVGVGKRYAAGMDRLGRRTRDILSAARRAGRIKRPARCDRCKRKGEVEAHHPDYRKPLEVKWLCPPCHESIHSKKSEVEKRVDAKFGGPAPINRFSIRWIEERSATLVREITTQQQDNVRRIVLRGFSQGLRGPAIRKQIEQDVGLLEREQKAVEGRFQTALEAGVPRARAEADRGRYADSLLRKRGQRIARTETIEAQAQGRNDAWALAQEQGLVPASMVREWVAATASDRTCAICMELDGQRVKIGEPYDSSVLGTAVQRPPAHPHCRCSEILVESKSPPDRKPKPKPRPRKPPRAKPRAVAGKPAPRSDVKTPRTGTGVKLTGRQKEADQNARWLRGKPQLWKTATPQELEDLFQWDWVHGSKRRTSVLFKQAAIEELKLKGVPFSMRKFKFTPEEIKAARRVVRKMHSDTQKELKRQGIKKLKVFRGVKGSTVVPGSVESWSTSEEVARSFGTFETMVDVVPAKKVLRFRGSPGWVDGIFGNQSEVMIIN